jgi:hypothetical protein
MDTNVLLVIVTKWEDMGSTPGTTPGYLSLPRMHKMQKPSISQRLYPVLLLALLALTTSAYTSLGVSRNSNPQPVLLKVSVYHTATSAVITTSEPPVLRGSKPTGSNLWTVLTDGSKPKCEEENNIYDLPLTKELIKYLHTSAGHPVKDTWAKAIKAENFTMWPGLSVKAVHKYFQESDETKQGHMKKTASKCTIYQNINQTKQRRTSS